MEADKVENVENTEKKSKLSKFSHIFLKGICIWFIIFSALTVIFYAKDWIYLFYPRTDAILENVDCKFLYTSTDDDGDDSDIYKCNIDLVYKVNGKKYYKKDVEIEEGVSSGKDISSKIKKGDKMTVWYNKKNPNKYGIRSESLLRVLTTCILVLVGLSLWYVLRHIDNEEEKC